MNDGKWVYNYEQDAERWDIDETYNTKDEAISAAIEDAAEYARDYCEIESEADDWLKNGSFDVGQIRKPTFSIDAEDIIEKIQEQFDEQCGEAAEDWMSWPSRNNHWRNLTGEERAKQNEHIGAYHRKLEDLSERIHEVVEKWMAENGELPNFSSIEDVATVRVRPE